MPAGFCPSVAPRDTGNLGGNAGAQRYLHVAFVAPTRELVDAFWHLWIRVRDVEAAAAFYATVAPHTGLREGRRWEHGRQFRGAWATFSLVADGSPPTENLHIAFPAPDRLTVEDFHRTATAAGYRDNSAPGERPHYHPGYYSAYVLDQDGTNVESVFRERG
jgi:catechol 2,3-dioxygenase-like lactoylglutathione lyase family enzyme